MEQESGGASNTLSDHADVATAQKSEDLDKETLDQNNRDAPKSNERARGAKYIKIISIGLALAAAILLVIVDLMKNYRPVFPAEAIMVVASIALALSAPSTHVAANLQYKHYKLWQPFEGSTAFILLQMIGWTMSATSVWLCLLALSALNALDVDGVLSFIGFLGIAGDLVLVASTMVFEDIEATSEAHNSFFTSIAYLGEAMQSRELRVSLMISATSTTVFFLLDIFQARISVPPGLVSLFTSIGFLASSFLTHAVAGRQRHPEYKIWQPFVGEKKFVLMQTIAWTLLGCVFTFTLIRSMSTGPLFSGLWTIVGILGLLSQVVLARSIQYFKAGNTVEFPASTSLVWVGETMLSLTLGGTGWLLVLICDYFSHFGGNAFPTTALMRISLLMTFSAAPLAHVGGQVIYVNNFKLWQPFVGGFRFVILQGLGWSVYGVTLAMIMVYLFNPDWAYFAISSLATANLTSYVLIFVSLSIYDPKDRAHTHRRIILKKGASSQCVTAFNGCIWTEEGVISLVLAFFAFAVFTVIDITRLRLQLSETESSSIPTSNFLLIAILAFVVAAPISQLGGKKIDSAFKFLQPFRGGGTFILLQMVGWTMYAYALLAQLVVAWNDLQTFTHGIITAIGGVGLVAQIVLAHSIQFFRHDGFDNFIQASPVVDARTLQRKSSGATVALSANTSVEGAQSLRDLSELNQLLDMAKRPAVRQALQAAIDSFVPRASSLSDHHQTSPASEIPSKFPVYESITTVFLAAASMCMFIILDLIHRSGFSSLSLRIFGITTVLATCMSPILTHFVLAPKMYPRVYKIWQPFEGGARFVLLQGAGWGICVLSTFILGPSCIAYGVERLSFDGLLTSCGVVSMTGQMLLFFSLHHFTFNENNASQYSGDSSARENMVDEFDEQVLYHDRDTLLSLAMVGCSLVLFVCVDLARRRYDSFPAMPVAICGTGCILAGIPISYFSSGRRRHNWSSIWDPLEKGHYGFVSLQVAGWSLYCIAFLLGTCSIYYTALDVPSGWLMSFVGLTGVTAHCLVVYSLSLFEDTSAASKTCSGDTAVPSALGTKSPKLLSQAWWQYVNENAPPACAAFFLYTVHLNTWGFAMAIVYLIGSWGGVFFYVGIFFRTIIRGDYPSYFVGLFYVGFCLHAALEDFTKREYFFLIADLGWLWFGVWYGCTYYNDHHLDGSRRSEWLRNGQFGRWFWDHMEKYFSFELVGEGKLDPKATYMLGYHPHGIYPFTLVWVPLTRQWHNLYPNIATDAFCAAALMNVPFVRDVAMWLGCRDVSRQAITHCLSNGRNAFLVPGGQAEMRESKSDHHELVLVYRHQGFVRLALQQQVSLVPVLSFGEQDIFDNVSYPRIQGWFVRKFGFGYPHFPYGRWKLPLPRAPKLKVVVGNPIPCPKMTVKDPYDPEIQPYVDEMHKKYFEEIERIFEKYKASAGFPDLTLRLKLSKY